MQKFLTTLAVLTVIATPAFAQSFCTCDGTGNVLKFTNNPITYQNQAPAIPAIGPSGLQAFAKVPRTRSAHVTHHKEGAASNGNWGFGSGICVVPEVNDPVGVWLPPQCEH
jgi:hypothetical protein